MLLFEKKLVFDAVIGVLGVLLPRFGGGVRLRPSISAEGTGKDDILLLKGVPSGSRFNGGSLMGWRFFLLLCGVVGLWSTSDPTDPTVSPLLCLIVPLLFWAESGWAGSSVNASMLWVSVTSESSCGVGGGIMGLNEDAVNEKLPVSGSFGDS
jgi:hypothetical protein